MRGKKVNSEFVADFIRSCVDLGMETDTTIVAHAKECIKSLDNEIKQLEEKKKLRAGWSDVISSLERPIKNKSEDAKLLPFFNLEKHDVCKSICDIVKVRPFPISKAQEKFNLDMRFAVKQLIAAGILARDSINDCLICGEKFSEYMQFVLHEAP